MESRGFDFQNFEPSRDLSLTAECMLTQLQRLAINPVALCATMLKNGDSYLCHVEIQTASGAFEEDVSSKEPMSAINQADYRLRRKIIDWQTAHHPEFFEDITTA